MKHSTTEKHEDKEQTTKAPLDKRIGLINMDRYMKSRTKSAKGHPKMGMYEKFSDKNNTESRTPSSSEERNMKYGWFQIVNDIVHYFQSPFNVALIVEQLSNYNMLLRENI